MKKKVSGLVVLVVFLVIGGYLWFGEISPEIQRIQKIQEDRDNAPTYQEKLNSMTVEDCSGVSGASPPEIRDRCQQIFRMAPPSIAANTQVKKDEVIQKLEENYLFSNYDLDELHFNITEEMLTPEGLEICANLWEDMVQKTLSIRTGDPDTIGEAMKSKSKFQSSGCAGTQNDWKK